MDQRWFLFWAIFSCLLVKFNADEVIPAEAIGVAAVPPTEASVNTVTSESKVLDSSIQSPVSKDDKRLVGCLY